MKGRLAWGLLASVVVGAAVIGAAPSLASAADAPAGQCGSKENPCPLQKWMRENMGGPMSSGDFAALEASFTKAAGFAPDKSWNGGDAKANWDSISKAGAEAAKKKDQPAVKAACKSCHDAFKDKYKAQFRTKAVP
jgi:hypothetical protein